MLVFKSAFNFLDVGKNHAFAQAVDFLAGGVVQAQHHVLRRHNGRFARSGEQHVVGGQHQGACFHLRFYRQRYVHSHLVTVKVGVEGRANEWVQLNGLAFNQQRLKRLNTQAVQRRRTVEQNRVFFNDFFKNVPHNGVVVFNLFLGCLDGSSNALLLQTGKDKGLEQFQRHKFGQAALVQLECWAHGNNRAPRVVHTLAQQVLAEAPALAFNHVGQRLERTLVSARHGFATAAVIEQAIYRLLQHTFFVACNDFRRFELKQAAQTAVAVDNAAVQVVQVRSGKTTAIQRNKRAQIGWQHGQHFQNHPAWLDARFFECFKHFEALGVFLDFQLRASQVATQAFDFGVDFDAFEQILDAFSAHFGGELIAIFRRVLVIVVFRHDGVLFQRSHAGVGHNVGFKVEHALNVAQGHVQHQTQAAGQRLEEPDVGARRGQINVPHALAAHFGFSDFYAAFFADNTTVLEAFVFAAQTFKIFNRAEDFGAEQTIALGFESAVVDGFGFFDFTKRPGTDFFRRSQTNFDGIKMLIGLE